MNEHEETENARSIPLFGMSFSFFLRAEQTDSDAENTAAERETTNGVRWKASQAELPYSIRVGYKLSH